MISTVEVIILSGFLGSGKTTLLQNLLTEEKRSGRKTAVLMNEIGDISIDSALLESSTPLMELLDGCICCTLKDELEITLLSLYKEHEPEVIYIEATGVAHPVDVLEGCLSPLLAPDMNVRSVISTIDAVRFLARETFSPHVRRLLEEQVKHADDLILNKTDLISAELIKKVQKEIRSFNSFATIHTTRFSQVPLAFIGYSQRYAQTNEDPVHVKDHLQIQSFTYQFKGSVSRQAFDEWLLAMPNDILRMKGFIRFFEDKGTTTLFQYSYGISQFFEEAIRLPANLVIIGENLDKAKIHNQLLQLEQQ
ncbi:GTP-binding protein [Jeotgalibacillus sp. S-D1]|uniref:CobW family GTP-binding protein n=1 Tax=Jeotgalibacillus sp. S-D1 TaxID=2552189 RepID=UPI001404CAA9|nr:GTP-binding protein [Jeotgalibacillus sp. S-D1]